MAANAGAWHPIIAPGARERLARLDYDFDALGRRGGGRLGRIPARSRPAHTGIAVSGTAVAMT